MKKVIYISRHKMKPQQRKAIKQLMNGQKYKIIHLNPIKLDFAKVKEIVEEYGRDAIYFIPSHIHIVDCFLWCGVKPYHFIMERKDATTCGAVPVYEFKEIKQVKYLK